MDIAREKAADKVARSIRKLKPLELMYILGAVEAMKNVSPSISFKDGDDDETENDDKRSGKGD